MRPRSPLSLLVLAAVAVLGACSNQPVPHVTRAADFDDRVVEAMSETPVQEGGRVKPLGTLAAYTLLQVHGRRDMKFDSDGDGKAETLTPTEWLLDVWCFPDQAAKYPLFRIENVEALDAIGIPHEGQKFGFEYISYEQMFTPGADGRRPVDRVLELGQKYGRKDAKDRSGVETVLVDTLENVHTYHGLHQLLAMLHSPIKVEGEAFQALFAAGDAPPRETVRFGELLQQGSRFVEMHDRMVKSPGSEPEGNVPAVVAMFEAILRDEARGAAPGEPALFPPQATRAEEEAWLSLGALTANALRAPLPSAQLAMLTHLQAAIAATDMAAKERELLAYRDAVVDRATQRGEFDKVALEADYYRESWHYKALHWFLFGIVVVAVGWLLPRSRLLWLGGIGVTGLALGFLVTDIAMRCVIRSRPPITNLYDTFLFIAAVGVLAALVTEIVTRRLVALAIAPIFGALLVQLARLFDQMDAKDTMQPLVAVLDTNYYLATHVTSINMGYAAGMLAAVLGTVALLLRGFGFRKDDATFHKSLVRMTYGVTCFALIFAVFGTIYGGVWANDSWGRFWGWDPKENGALLICLSLIALLHARMCGWVRDVGFCVWAGLTGNVVAFSWFHVNLLEVGLHSYGFASGLKGALVTYYVAQSLLIGIGLAGIAVQRVRALEAAAAAAAAKAAPGEAT